MQERAARQDKLMSQVLRMSTALSQGMNVARPQVTIEFQVPGTKSMNADYNEQTESTKLHLRPLERLEYKGEG
jgi:hypothetical protein